MEGKKYYFQLTLDKFILEVSESWVLERSGYERARPSCGRMRVARAGKSGLHCRMGPMDAGISVCVCLLAVTRSYMVRILPWENLTHQWGICAEKSPDRLHDKHAADEVTSPHWFNKCVWILMVTCSDMTRISWGRLTYNCVTCAVKLLDRFHGW